MGKKISSPAGTQTAASKHYGHLSRLLDCVVYFDVGPDFNVEDADPACAGLVLGCWTGDHGQPQLVVADARGRLVCHDLETIMLVDAARELDAAFTDVRERQAKAQRSNQGCKADAEAEDIVGNDDVPEELPGPPETLPDDFNDFPE